MQETDADTDDATSDSSHENGEAQVESLFMTGFKCNIMQSERDPYPLCSSNIDSRLDKDEVDRNRNYVIVEDRRVGKGVRRCLFTD